MNKTLSIGQSINNLQSLKIDPDFHQDDVSGFTKAQSGVVAQPFQYGIKALVTQQKPIHFKTATAFTLAEVLITLAIIGIVATMTIPMLIRTYQKRESVSMLKKMYSTLTNAAKMYEAEHGVPIEQFDTSLAAQEFMYEYINPYLRVVDECDDIADCYDDKIPLAIDRKTELARLEYLSKLADGSFFGIIYSAPAGKVFFLDTNGPNAPNYSGRDIFYFYLVNLNTIKNFGDCSDAVQSYISKGLLQTGFYPGSFGSCYVPHASYTRGELLGTTIHRTCNKNAYLKNSTESGYWFGDACAAVIMLDGWKIADDYPW